MISNDCNENNIHFDELINSRDFINRCWHYALTRSDPNSNLPSWININTSAKYINHIGQNLEINRFITMASFRSKETYESDLVCWKETRKRVCSLSDSDVSFLLIIFDRISREIFFVMPACMVYSKEYHRLQMARIIGKVYEPIPIDHFIVLNLSESVRALCSLIVHDKKESLPLLESRKFLSVVEDHFDRFRHYQNTNNAQSKVFPWFPSIINRKRQDGQPILFDIDVQRLKYIKPIKDDYSSKKDSSLRDDEETTDEEIFDFISSF